MFADGCGDVFDQDAAAFHGEDLADKLRLGGVVAADVTIKHG
jgi:hypothetical protein